MEREDIEGNAEDSSLGDSFWEKWEKTEYFILLVLKIVQLFPEMALFLKYIFVSAAAISGRENVDFCRIGFFAEKVVLFGKNASIKGEV